MNFDIIESDRDYFRAGATITSVPGGIVAESGSRGPVVLVDDLDHLDANPLAWHDSIVANFDAMVALRLRIYLPARRGSIARSFRSLGMRERVELLYAGVPALAEAPALSLDLIETAADWCLKEAFHTLVPDRPDGHRCSAAEWTAFERAKAYGLGMASYLVRVEAESIAAVSTIPREGFLRVKNLVIHPNHRGKGIGHQILSKIAYSRVEGPIPLGMLAVAGGRGEHLYRQAGLTTIGEYFEWSYPEVPQVS